MGRPPVSTACGSTVSFRTDMAGLYMKGHFALASLPVSGKPRGFHTSPWSSMSITTAKAGPKLETRVLEEPDTGEPTTKIRVSEKSERGRNPALDSKKKIRASVTEEPTLASGMEDVELENPGTMENRVSEEEDTEEPDGEDMNLEFSAVEEMDADMDMFVPPGAVISEEKPLRRLPGSNIYLGPFANNSRVKQAEFVKSSSGVADCPDAKLPEFALVGRSNVGKSSLINSLVQRKDLAQTSKKPGKTQLINHFIINKSWYLVDLPGYGYAKVPTVIRTSWDGFTKEFFLRSKSLVCVMLLIDATIPPQQIDLEYAAWLRQNKVPLTIVFTKCDRKKKKKNGGRKPEENLKDFLRLLKSSLEQLPPWIMTSCVTNQGKDALLMHMAQLRNYWSS